MAGCGHSPHPGVGCDVRILLISFLFPPFNSMGAVRTGKTAKYLCRLGHDVRVLCADNQPYGKTLPVEIPVENIRYTTWRDMRSATRIVPCPPDRYGRAVNDGSTAWRRFRRSLGVLYRTVICFPDPEVGWVAPAVRAGAEWVGTWKPDMIYASAEPYSSLLVARRLARRFHVPWIAELRDLWADYPIARYYRWRKPWEAFLERRVLSASAALVTVSDPLRDILQRKYADKSVAVITNGFDLDDHPASESRSSSDQNILTISYFGTIYEGKRDPGPLFDALGLLGPLAKQIRIRFYSRQSLSAMRHRIVERGLSDRVEFLPEVAYGESLKLQRESDVLLLLTWNDPGERGICSGKLFEYMGARRPILAIGTTSDVATELIRRRVLGKVANTPEAAAEALRSWLNIKRELGFIQDLSVENVMDFSREEQTRRLEQFMREVCASSGSRLEESTQKLSLSTP